VPRFHERRILNYSVGFYSWVSIKDGMNGMEDLRESVQFLKQKIDLHFTELKWGEYRFCTCQE
jgi:hypothetical protein